MPSVPLASRSTLTSISVSRVLRTTFAARFSTIDSGCRPPITASTLSFSASVPTVILKQPAQPEILERSRTITCLSSNSEYMPRASSTSTRRKLASEGHTFLTRGRSARASAILARSDFMHSTSTETSRLKSVMAFSIEANEILYGYFTLANIAIVRSSPNASPSRRAAIP